MKFGERSLSGKIVWLGGAWLWCLLAGLNLAGLLESRFQNQRARPVIGRPMTRRRILVSLRSPEKSVSLANAELNPGCEKPRNAFAAPDLSGQITDEQ